MTRQVRAIWDALEFRMPTVLEKFGGLPDAELSWQPPNGANSIVWRYPFGASVEAGWPTRRG